MTMLEKAADAAGIAIDNHFCGEQHISEEFARLVVRAVLTAIREPDAVVLKAIRDEAMNIDNYSSVSLYSEEQRLSDVRDAWRAGVDAILGEKP